MALFYMPNEGIRVTQGELRVYRSSPEVDRYFCANCGAPVFFHRLSRPDQKAITAGSLDDHNDFEVKMQVCLSSAVKWLDTCHSAPAYDEKPEGMTPTLQYDPVTGAVADG
jgi:hypothetical protein